MLDGRHCWAVDVGPDGEGGARDDVVDLFRLWSSVDETTWALAGRAVQLVEWQRNHRFCGRCGTPTVEAPGERATKCPACGLLAYPRLAPAVIMLVERDDGHALLARNANFPSGMFSCLAGFVEPGETLEHAVRREVMEEVGLTVGDVEFRGSQPWPFPHQVMIGFGAQYLSGEIEIDGQEIVEAQWFTPDDTPNFPTGGHVDRGPPHRRVAQRGSADSARAHVHRAAGVGLADHVGVRGHVAEAAMACSTPTTSRCRT